MNMNSGVRLSLEVGLEPAAALDLVVRELMDALARSGIEFLAGTDGKVMQSGFEVGQVIRWKAGEGTVLRWRAADWLPDEFTEMELSVEKVEGGARVRVEQRGTARLLGEAEEVAGWFAGEVAAPFMQALTPGKFGDWVTDRKARRPSGAQSRAIYRDPIFHYPNFRVILRELALTREDYLLDVGCGGGALLKEALQCGCRAAAIDHSFDMVRLAQETNAAAVAEGRLVVKHSSAERLPFADGTFSCAIMTGVLGFLPDPVSAFRGIRRVLRRGGRFVGLGSDPRMRGTPAAPEPMASRLHFYKDDELEKLAREGGFEEARVVQRELGHFAREVGVPREALPLFEGATGFLIARRRE
jgi:SAM-dependent methyltransferase